MFAGNIAPDVIFMYPEALPVWAELGALLPLNELAERDPEFDVDDYFQVMIRTFTYNGILFALPKDASADIMQYNVDLFERLGVDPPDESWTWEDFLDAAKRLTIDEDGDGRPEVYGTSSYHWFNWVRQNGGRILSGDGKRCLLDSPEAIEAIQYAADLVYRHHVAPPPAVTMDTSPTILFTQGRIAMHAQMYPVVSILRERCDFMWDLAPLPGPPRSAGPRGKRSVRAVGSGMAITSQCKHPEAAWEWIKWMTGPKGMRGLLSVEMPSCKSLARTEFLRGPTDVPEDDPIRLPLNRTPAVASMAYAELPPQSADYFRMMDIINNGLDPVFRGKAQARDVLPDLVREVNEFLEEGR
jgi:multiple sugar transport system substrate-binding protein